MKAHLDDLRAAVRGLRRAPGFFLGAALVLGLGLGVSLFAWRLLDAALFRPLPGVERPEEVMAARLSLSYATLRDLRQEVDGEMDLAGVARRTMVADLGGGPETVAAGVVTGNALSMLGVKAAAGRMLAEADDRPGAAPVAVVSARLAERLAGSAAAAVGRPLTLHGVPFEVVGVANPDFRRLRFGAMRDVWVTVRAWSSVRPSSMAGLSEETRGWSWITPMGRLRPGVEPARAQARLRAAAAAQVAAYPGETRDNLAEALTLTPASDAAIGDLAPGLRRGLVATLLAAGVAIFLLACANVAHLVGSRVAARVREFATRRALGGSGRREAGFLAAEALLIAAGGALAGTGVSAIAGRALRDVELPGGWTLASLDLAPDAATATIAAGLAFAATLLVSLAAAARARRVAGFGALRGSSSMALRRGRRVSAAVVTQVAMGFALLAVAALLARAAREGLSRDVGYRAEGLAIVAYDLGLARIDPARAWPAHAEAVRAVEALPGIRAAALTSAAPLDADSNTESFELPGLDTGAPGGLEAEVVVVGPRLLETMGIPLLAGRAIDESDREGGLGVAVANRAFVERYLLHPGAAMQDALDRAIDLASGRVRVVGVAENILAHSFAETPPPLLYLALRQRPVDEQLQRIELVVRQADGMGDQALPLGSIAAALRRALPGVPLAGLGTVADRFEDAVGPQRLLAGALGGFGVLGLVLLAAGTHAVVALMVVRRRREIGVRSALGASPRALVVQSAAVGLRSVAGGLALGLPLAVAAGFLARGLLFGLAPADPVAILAGAGAVLAVAGVAAALPARNATRVEPAEVLRADG